MEERPELLLAEACELVEYCYELINGVGFAWFDLKRWVAIGVVWLVGLGVVWCGLVSVGLPAGPVEELACQELDH